MQEGWIKRCPSESLAGCGVEGGWLSQEGPALCATGGLVWGAHPKSGVPPEEMLQVCMLWCQFGLVSFPDWTGLGDSTVGTGVQVMVGMDERK